MNCLLRVDSLTVSLRGKAAIVDGVSFSIAAGETFALLGESGCGKSMTALSLMRLLPDGVVNVAGRAELEGIDLLALPEHRMRRMRGSRLAMIFQEPGLSLNPVMTVGRQIAEVLRLHQGLSRMAADAQVVELLRQVGIPDAVRRMQEYPFRLSGGMKQRVMIAMALAGAPRLLIADEPTTALDVTIQAQVLQLLREIQQQNGMAMLLITHDLGVVAENAHRVGVMYAGQIVEQGTRAGLFAHPLHPYTQKLFAALPDTRRNGRMLAAIPGSVPPLGSILPGCRFAPRCDRALARCHEESPQWHEVMGQRVRCHLYGDAGYRLQDTVAWGSEPERGNRERPAFRTLPALLQVQDLRVHFPIRKGILQRVVGQVKAVDGVSFSIPQGHTLALVGESGCGKTTLGKALLNLIPRTAGSVMLDGRPLGKGTHVAGLQMVFQDPYASLNPRMRVANILEEGMRALRIGKDSVTRQRSIDELLERVGLAADAKWRYPHEFSGGQRQRIAIARALAVAPRLLVCDEPTSALDVSVQAQILNLLKTLQQELGLSYLFITHNLGVVQYLAEELCVMYLGRIVERGRVEEVMRTPKHPYTQALLSAVPRIDGAGRQYVKLEGELPSPANPPSGCHFAPRCPHVMPVCVQYPDAIPVSGTHTVCCHL